MKIHPLNYEQYALDYLEGNLEPETKTVFEEFLAEHPSIEKELQEMKLFYATPDQSKTFPNKVDLLKSTPSATASVFNLPAWAIAASWLIAIGSFAVWLYNPNQTSVNGQVTSNHAVIETMDEVEEDIIVVQVDVERPSTNTGTTVEQVESEAQYHQPVYTTNNHQATEVAKENSTEGIHEFNRPAPQNQEAYNAIAYLPQHTDLNDMEVLSQTPEVVYYKPINNWGSHKTNVQPTEEESRLALMDPLKRVMKPEGYKKIREFDLMDDVIMEIDGREVAHAFTPEFLRNNR